MPRKKKTYRVVGEAPVDINGKTYRKDDEFEASLDKAHEDFLVGVGGLEVVKGSSKDK